MIYICPYCGKEHESDKNGVDIVCCHEKGHCIEKSEYDDRIWDIDKLIQDDNPLPEDY